MDAGKKWHMNLAITLVLKSAFSSQVSLIIFFVKDKNNGMITLAVHTFRYSCTILIAQLMSRFFTLTPRIAVLKQIEKQNN